MGFRRARRGSWILRLSLNQIKEIIKNLFCFYLPFCEMYSRISFNALNSMKLIPAGV